MIRIEFFPIKQLGGIPLYKIESIESRQILDSRGNPTVETVVHLSNGAWGKAAVPSGASTGEHEALELRISSKPETYEDKYVTNAVANVNGEISKRLIGMNALNQEEIDRAMIELDGTENKSRLGANAILSVSMANAAAVANALNQPLLAYINPFANTLPVCGFNVLNGGVHANWVNEIQEKMIMPVGFPNYRDALFATAKVYHTLRELLKKDVFDLGLGDEGGFAPRLAQNETSLVYIMRAIIKAGFEPGLHFFIALDPAASGYFKNGKYQLKSDNLELTPTDKVELFKNWIEKYPIISIEDGFAENDNEGWKLATQQLKEYVLLVGDDLFVTNPKILRKGIEKGIANAVLIKVNQIGTLTETFETVEIANQAAYRQFWSHRSGETEDVSIAHYVVAAGSGLLKTGAPARGERTAKYNELLRIEEILGKNAVYPGLKVFPNSVQQFAHERFGKWANWKG